jgi:hypothetical protein
MDSFQGFPGGFFRFGWKRRESGRGSAEQKQ